jgi:stage V sporulation protein B
VLVGNPNINIVGAPIGTICCYFVMCVMNAIFIKKSLVKKPSYTKIIVRPLISSLVMGAGAWGVYGILSRVLSGGGDLGRIKMALAMLVAIGVAVIIYLVLIIATHAITAEDMRLIPKGDKLAKLLRIK